MSQDVIDNRVNYVIASALRLRENPNKTAKTLTVIPFGSRVEYLTNQSYNKDTLNVELGEYNKDVIGNWVYVKYNDIKGYVLNSYLGFYEDPDLKYKDLNKEFLLLFPGCGCQLNIFNPLEWNYYGFYKSDNNSFDVKKITIANISDFEDIICSVIISASHPKNLLFVVGSKNPFLSNTHNLFGKQVEIQFNDDKKVALQNLNAIGIELVNSVEDYKLFLNLGSSKQKLNLENFNYPDRVNFFGDIDFDGKDDLIITYGSKVSESVLYLSSKGNGKQLVKMVAIFFSTYCC
ncbi:MAG: SH3 domain-containing protein [Saprospiraceae bacterium]|nr:SH3 domain-containing protein [Saprospiraceae bacterium]